jgi:hypothetical protein
MPIFDLADNISQRCALTIVTPTTLQPHERNKIDDY